MGKSLETVSDLRKIDVSVGDGSVTVAVHSAKTYSGPGTRPNIVLIHGNSLSSKMFADQLGDASLGFSYDMYSIDLPGHGDSASATPQTESC
jgi:pimeloyl-ACP methyl ester carboxylesterase